MNRLKRDEILHRALDMVDSASLDQKDRPGGTIQQNAMCIGWLQDALDYVHNRYPWATIATQTISITAGTINYALPSDYILDVRDGVRITATPEAWRLVEIRVPMKFLHQ